MSLRPALTMLTIGGLLSTCGPVRPPVLQSLQVRDLGVMELVPFDHAFSGVNYLFFVLGGAISNMSMSISLFGFRFP